MKRTDWIVVLLVGVLILIIAVPTGGTNKKQNKTEGAEKKETIIREQQENYKVELEEELEAILSNMSGVGKVRVMITLKNDGADILDKDVSRKEESYEENTVIYQKDEGDTPYIISQNVPEIEGVVIVAEGAGNPVIETNISEVVMALFDVEVHKIKVVKMSV